MTTIECQPELNIAQAGELHRQLLPALAAQQDLEIDGDPIKRVHAAVLQLFMCLVIEAKARNLTLHWRNPSPALVEAAQLLGLSDSLGLPKAKGD